jgi:glyoxylase-like metal-dependent hydrolase (beta-lactamase superfamily II)
MSQRWFAGVLCLALVAGAAWLGRRGAEQPAAPTWVEVAPGVLRSGQLPAGYALIDGDRALLIDAPRGPDGLAAHGVKKVDLVFLTHHHRDTCAAAEKFLADGVPVRASKAAAEWLTPTGVAKYWQESLPLRNSRTAYLVLPVGLQGVDCSLADGQTLTWRGWTVRVVATPGHSRDHVAYAARKKPADPWLVFSGDALAEPGKLWTPYTTDWDHWTDAGLAPAAKSLRALADLKPALLLPAHGPVIDKNPTEALTRTATAVEEVAFLKSFERYTKQRLGNAPQYPFLAKEQAESNGSKPWTQVSPSLFLTGNTYVLVSKEKKAFLVMDPWAKRGADQVAKLRQDQKLGPLEVVMFSHAHYDHYDGIYDMPDRKQESYQIWALDSVAGPIAEPYRLRAPFLDARPVKFDRTPKDGDTLTWREYRFRFHHLPGQSEFTMGVETVIDGKRCFFTADNWFHQDQFSGSGGWMGLNRSWPLAYAASAQKVLDAAPEWVLAEHGGPFAFHAEDFRRRVQWGKVSAKAADAVCVSGNHLKDWNPHRVRAEPVVQKAKAGAVVNWSLVVENAMKGNEKVSVTLEGRGLMKDQAWTLDVPAGGAARRALSFQVPGNLGAGRHVFILRSAVGNQPDVADAFAVVDVE